jgi:hypothetical protein
VDIQIALPLIPIGPVCSLQPFIQSLPFAVPGSTLLDELVEPPPFDQCLSTSVMSCLGEECWYIIAISCCYKDEREEKGLHTTKLHIKIEILIIFESLLEPLHFIPGHWFYLFCGSSTSL